MEECEDACGASAASVECNMHAASLTYKSQVVKAHRPLSVHTHDDLSNIQAFLLDLNDVPKILASQASACRSKRHARTSGISLAFTDPSRKILILDHQFCRIDYFNWQVFFAPYKISLGER